MISRAKFGKVDAMSYEYPKFDNHGSLDDPKRDTSELSVDAM